MAGSITWRVQLGGADQARADLRSLGDAASQGAREAAAAWDSAGQRTEAEISRANTLRDAWIEADAQRRAYASDLRSSGAARPATNLEDQQNALAAAVQAAQSRINATTGVGAGSAGSARASASAFAEQLGAMERLEARANTLRTALDPLQAAQQKYGSAVKEAATLVQAGVISEAEHAAAVGAAKKALEEAEKAALAAGSGLHLTSVQAMELEHSARAMVDAVMAGRNPFQALAMEGGRLAQTMGEGQGGVAGSLTALRSIVLGPIGAVGALAAAFLTATAAEQSFEASERQMERYLMGAGREAGVTTTQLMEMSDKAAAAGNVSEAAARGMTASFLQTGQIGVQVIPQLIALQRDFAAATGVDAKAAVEQLAKVMSDPARGAEELNKSLHFLDDQQLEHIRLLMESGERTQAQVELTRQLTDAVGPAAEHLSTLGQALHDVAKAFSDAWVESGKFFYNLTHVPDAKDGVAAIQARMSDVRGQLSAVQYSEGGQVAAAQLRDELATLQKSLVEAQKSTAHPGLTPAQNEVSTRAGEIARAEDPALAERERLTGEIAKLQASKDQNYAGSTPEVAAVERRLLSALTRQRDTLMTPAQKEVEESQIRAELAARPGASRRGQLQERMAQLQTAGQQLTPEEAAAIQASGLLQGQNRGARVDQSAAKRAEAEANKAEAAQKASDDTIAKAQEAATKAEETIATSKAAQAKSALDALAGDASLTAGERQTRILQAAAELSIANAKDDRLKLELQRIEQERKRQVDDVNHQHDWTDGQRSSAIAAINASSGTQADAARAQDATRQSAGNDAATSAGNKFMAAMLKSQASDTGLPTAVRVQAEQQLLDLQHSEAQARLEEVLAVKGVTDATKARDRAALSQSEGAEAELAAQTQVRSLAQAAMQAAKALATTQDARNAIERDQLRISQEQRDAATKILIGQLDEAVAAGAMAKATRDRLAAELTTAQTSLNGSENETLRRQQLTPLGKLSDASTQPSAKDLTETDAAEASQRLASAFVSLEMNTTRFGAAMRGVVTSLQQTVLTQLTNRAMAPINNWLDKQIDGLFPSLGGASAATSQTAMAQAATVATTAITALANAAAAAATRMGLSGGLGGGLLGIGTGGGDGISFDSLQASGQWADFDSFAGGGLFRGAGSGTSDSNVARVSDGEYIVNSRATSANLDLLHNINNGGMPGYAEGGYVTDRDSDRRRRAMAVSSVAGVSSGGSGRSGDVHLHNHTGQPMKATTSQGSNGDMMVHLAPMFEKASRGRASDPNGLARDLRMLPQTRKTRVR